MVKHAANGIQIAGLRCVCPKRTGFLGGRLCVCGGGGIFFFLLFLKDLFFSLCVNCAIREGREGRQ